MSITTATLGYPRIGKSREVKKALESFWRNDLPAEELLQIVQSVEEASWTKQAETGIEHIGIGDATLYDQMLDWSVRLGLIPSRFHGFNGLERYFAMARGKDGVPALEMTKWFDTNYHYLVPEITADITPKADFSDFIAIVKRGVTQLGEKAVPIIISPLTLLRLSRLEGVKFEEILSQLLPLYSDLLAELKTLGIKTLQIHDPILVFNDSTQLKAHFQIVYAELAKAGLDINLVTYFDDLGETYPWVMELPVKTISLDFTRGNNLELLKKHGFPADKILGAGVVDGRNIWRIRPKSIISLLDEIQSFTDNLSVQPSSSLQFVPYDATREVKLPEPLRNVLSFAEQKLEEVVILGKTLKGDNTQAEMASIGNKWDEFSQFSPVNQGIKSKLENLTPNDFQRSLSYTLRIEKQVSLPPLPTTTIGSFPQTQEVRKLRLQYKRGDISQADYQKAMEAEIAECIKIQEEIGLDVLVHGEFERTDMVEYFGQQLDGFAFTEQGWVQSYGSRYVRPPIIFGDVVRNAPMTVTEYQFAQSLTEKPVKGMLTGPVTILNWSFPRSDISRKEQAYQIAIAIQEEVTDLEKAGAQVIQVDEPALREGLPLKQEKWHDYLSWAVDAFRLATASVQPQTQIHTHMCYCEFGDIIQEIERLDADVISIENSRSNNRTLQEVTEGGYSHQIGNGVYDIHSPVIPTVEQLTQQLKAGISNLPLQQIWVNPDCGLKTRRWEEVIPSLKNMVKATQKLRDELKS
jgi:5-methyltetrahydropteroyltriglutamate--homocysteine methyltransferase